MQKNAELSIIRFLFNLEQQAKDYMEYFLINQTQVGRSRCNCLVTSHFWGWDKHWSFKVKFWNFFYLFFSSFLLFCDKLCVFCHFQQILCASERKKDLSSSNNDERPSQQPTPKTLTDLIYVLTLPFCVCLSPCVSIFFISKCEKL